MSNHPTSFMRANALLYVEKGDYDAARECLRQILPAGLFELEIATSDLIDLIKEIRAERRGEIRYEPS